MAPDERGAQAPRLFPIFAGGAAPPRAPKARRTTEPKRAPTQAPPPPPPPSRAVRGTGGAAHPFFAKRAGASEPVSSARADSPAAHATPAPAAPWPSAETTHVAPPRTTAARQPLTLPPTWSWRAPRGAAAAAPHPPRFVAPHTACTPPPTPARIDSDAHIACEAALSHDHRVPAPRNPLAYIAGDLAGAAQDPRTFAGALQSVYAQLQAAPPASLADARRADAPPTQWVDRWRPRRAADVLANEGAATYLRDWLHELRVSYAADAPRRRPVQTRVAQRKRGRPRVYGEEFDSEEEAWLDQFRTAAAPAAGAAAAAAPAPLTNCVLLQGATGSGKSAAVYACAAELGYAVFEVYAGLGRRSGKELVSAVGQLARNHMVASEGAAPRQSLILLDEVDVLFDDDAGFWAAVVELVRDSRRPVILTCSDASRVPRAELPIQTTLHFVSPPPDVAATYLQLVALAEGYIVSQASAHALYAQTCAAPPDELGSGPVHPGCAAYPPGRADGDAPAYDLRAALMQLQWVCLYTRARALREAPRSGGCGGGAPPAAGPPAAAETPPAPPAPPAPRVRGPPALQLVDHLRRLADTASVCDLVDVDVPEAGAEPLPPWARAHIAAPPPPRCTAPAGAPAGTHAGAALAHALGTLAARMWRHASATYAGAPADADVVLPRPHARLGADRLAHCQRLAHFLALLHVPPSEALPRAPLVVEYAPYVRQMLYLDELQQLAHVAQLQTADAVRATRTSTHLLYDTTRLRGAAHVPWIALGPAERAAGHATGFCTP
ncbi:hypothetical protein MOBT1_001898 [Malassezia obtusa]|uniref:AAA+ ATPase domain-containing protein n=1 Tax=Malassezia obtusa TaxID=76774 RepID=A0AAF0E265_9BASI|nr:hypothetical protein MOBT1_001898 [Malassezia obtusa]